MKIPGLSFSWKRALGVTAFKQKVARTTGIPTTRGGLERKVGRHGAGHLVWQKATQAQVNRNAWEIHIIIYNECPQVANQ